MKQIICSTLIIISSIECTAKLVQNYSQVALRDLDQVATVVKNKLKESRNKNSDKQTVFKDAVLEIYARPDDDGVIEKVMPPLKNEMDSKELTSKVYSAVVDECIFNLNNPDGLKPVEQVTYQIILENILAEFKPKISKNKFAREQVQKISDAKITMTKEANKERLLRSMNEKPSPSEVAEKILSNSQ